MHAPSGGRNDASHDHKGFATALARETNRKVWPAYFRQSPSVITRNSKRDRLALPNSRRASARASRRQRTCSRLRPSYKCVVVWALPARQPQIWYLVPAVHLQLSTGAYSGHKAKQPHTHQHLGMIGRRSQPLALNFNAQFSPVLSVQGVDELGHESVGIVQGQ